MKAAARLLCARRSAWPPLPWDSSCGGRANAGSSLASADLSRGRVGGIDGISRQDPSGRIRSACRDSRLLDTGLKTGVCNNLTGVFSRLVLLTDQINPGKRLRLVAYSPVREKARPVQKAAQAMSARMQLVELPFTARILSLYGRAFSSCSAKPRRKLAHRSRGSRATERSFSPGEDLQP